MWILLWNYFSVSISIARFIFSIVQNLRGRPEGEESNKRRKRKRKNNIKMYLKDSSWNVDWVHLVLDKIQWRVLVKKVMNFHVPLSWWGFLTGWATISLLKRGRHAYFLMYRNPKRFQSVRTIYSIHLGLLKESREDDVWITNWKNCGRQRSWPIWSIGKNWDKPRENTFKIRGVQAEKPCF
jgi:hypothetical protein